MLAGGGGESMRGGRWSAVHAYRQAREAATRAVDDYSQGMPSAVPVLCLLVPDVMTRICNELDCDADRQYKTSSC